jgi:transposase
MPHEAKILGLPGYEIKEIERLSGHVLIHARYTGRVYCPHCGHGKVHRKARFIRDLRHETIGLRPCHLLLESFKYHCLGCLRYFNQRFPGIMPRRRSTEPFRRQIFWRHYDGICRSTLAKREAIGSATVARWFHDHLKLEALKLSGEPCPQILGIDEHFFTRKLGFATTLCDLKNHKVYDVVLGRSEASLEAYFEALRDREKVKVVCMDLSSTYRALVRRYFPQAKIVADRFHVIRLVGQAFRMVWKQLDAQGNAHRGLRSLVMRRPDRLSPEQQIRLADYLKKHPALEAVYAFKQQVDALLREKTCTARRCRELIPHLLDYIEELKASGFTALQSLGTTIDSWKQEVAAMWRFSKNNGITEGFHNKMEMIARRAYGFRNFNNYRTQVRVMCS